MNLTIIVNRNSSNTTELICTTKYSKLKGVLCERRLFDYNSSMFDKWKAEWQEFQRAQTLPTLGLFTPEANDRAVARLSPEDIKLALDEIRVTDVAKSIRQVFEQPFVEAGIDFPPLLTTTYGEKHETIVSIDPLRTAIVFWERANEIQIEKAVIDRGVIEEILGHISVEQGVEQAFAEIS